MLYLQVPGWWGRGGQMRPLFHQSRKRFSTQRDMTLEIFSHRDLSATLRDMRFLLMKTQRIRRDKCDFFSKNSYIRRQITPL